MSIPALDGWFALNLRRNRLSFILAYAALCATSAVCVFVWFYFAETERGKQIGFLLFGVPAIVCSYLLVAQRLRDLNLSGWFALLWFPINLLEGQLRLAITLAIIIILCAIPGTAGANKYGDNPLG